MEFEDAGGEEPAVGVEGVGVPEVVELVFRLDLDGGAYEFDVGLCALCFGGEAVVLGAGDEFFKGVETKRDAFAKIIRPCGNLYFIILSRSRSSDAPDARCGTQQ